MKKIIIRFINRNNKDYLIQKKTWFGWKYIRYSQMGMSGDFVDILYCEDTKEKLLTKVLELYYLTDKRFVTVIEYPEIKHY